ncbi:MAG: class II fructose-bisphosphate aldolase [Lachnospiraceae bacterium]|nr:class II fructose-bisphosphate aldolase [Lachnospiraceae bacterium]
MLVNLNEILIPAQKGRYGVGFFNAVNVEMARAIIETAEEMKAPVIVGTAEVLLKTTELVNVADYLIPMAKRASVPVCVHYDHGLTFERCMQALDLGFTSIMYDCSTLPYEENTRQLRHMVGICHDRNVTVEGELGHVGDNEGSGRLERPEDYYTDPRQAEDYVRNTGVDALAIAVGNAHGDYRFAPKLDFERIHIIAQKTGIPLVLHGGSGLSDDDFTRAVAEGICKINIFTDIDKAGKTGTEKGIASGGRSMCDLIPYEIEAMKDVVRHKISLFMGRSHAYIDR